MIVMIVIVLLLCCYCAVIVIGDFTSYTKEHVLGAGTDEHLPCARTKKNTSRSRWVAASVGGERASSSERSPRAEYVHWCGI